MGPEEPHTCIIMAPLWGHTLCMLNKKLPLHCKLSQEISNCEKGRRHVCRQLNTSMESYFSEYGLLKKIMSDEDGNFISDKFKQFCKNMNMEQATSSSYYHQSNRQVEAYIKFIKHTMKACIETNNKCSFVT